MSLVEIKPDVLEYKPPFTEQATEYVTITNNSEEPIAFKVKTTAPKFYCVRPNAAVVAPGENVQIQIIFLGLPKEPEVDFKCRDKFLVITLPCPNSLGNKTVAEAWNALEKEFSKQAISKKIRVKYMLEENVVPPSSQYTSGKAATLDSEKAVLPPGTFNDNETPVTTPNEGSPVAREAVNTDSNNNNVTPIIVIVLIAILLRLFFFN